MTLEEITKQLEKNGNTKEEQIRIIRKSRAQLLDEIHGKQQLLDRLDYMLYQMKEGGRESENEDVGENGGFCHRHGLYGNVPCGW